MSAPAPNSANTPAPAEPLPGVTTLQHAARLSIKEDKPIMLDYFMDTYTNKAFMGEDQETKEKMLVKSSDEFTSLMTAMGIQAETAGIGEEFKTAYRELCWLKNGAQAAK